MSQLQNRFLDPAMIVSRLGITDGMQVADLGCGTGHLVLALARAVSSDGHAYAVDLDPEMVSSARSYVFHEGYRNATFIVADLITDQLSEIPSGTLDLVVISNTLHEILTGREQVIGKAINLIKKGGQLLVIEWQKKETLFGPPLSHRIDRTEVIALLKSHGYRHKDSFCAGVYHYGEVFEAAQASEKSSGSSSSQKHQL